MEIIAAARTTDEEVRDWRLETGDSTLCVEIGENLDGKLQITNEQMTNGGWHTMLEKARHSSIESNKEKLRAIE